MLKNPTEPTTVGAFPSFYLPLLLWSVHIRKLLYNVVVESSTSKSRNGKIGKHRARKTEPTFRSIVAIYIIYKRIPTWYVCPLIPSEKRNSFLRDGATQWCYPLEEWYCRENEALTAENLILVLVGILYYTRLSYKDLFHFKMKLQCGHLESWIGWVKRLDKERYLKVAVKFERFHHACS